MIRSLSSTPNAPSPAATAARLCARGCYVVAVVVLVAACGGGSDTGASTASTVVAATTSPFDAAQAVTTTAVAYSRDTREALVRCRDVVDSLGLYVTIEVPYGVTDALDEAIALCDEAQLQLEVDGDTVLKRPMSELIVAMDFAKLAILGDALDGTMDEDHTADIATLQAACDTFTQLTAG